MYCIVVIETRKYMPLLSRTAPPVLSLPHTVSCETVWDTSALFFSCVVRVTTVSPTMGARLVLYFLRGPRWFLWTDNGGRAIGRQTGRGKLAQAGKNISQGADVVAACVGRHASDTLAPVCISPSEYSAQRCIPVHPASYDDLSLGTGTMLSYLSPSMCPYPASGSFGLSRCVWSLRSLGLGLLLLRQVSAEDECGCVVLTPTILPEPSLHAFLVFAVPFTC